MLASKRAPLLTLAKAELRLQTASSLESEMMVVLTPRNGIRLPYGSVVAVQTVYQFENL
ncbi:hypothetical protein [Nodosilinea sp. FACHB-13]|uniref:hypothetical protein n=1 Tax=Leptolyngbya subtilissima TaxID=1346803 RepID=UPI00168954C4|nr:hypothetical protein [Nodosilinea sp. FACHB-13]